MLPRCQASARGGRREGGGRLFSFECFLRFCFCLRAWASYRFHMIDNWTSAVLRERYDAPIWLNHGYCFGDVKTNSKSSGHFVSHRLSIGVVWHSSVSSIVLPSVEVWAVDFPCRSIICMCTWDTCSYYTHSPSTVLYQNYQTYISTTGPGGLSINHQ